MHGYAGLPATRRLPIFGALLLLAGAGLGCGTVRARSTELARVAKDWCLAIRASQVMPVYPLSEDIQPGDVFLVRQTAAQEIAEYQAKGFLPMENLIARLQPEVYSQFYLDSYGIKGHTDTPRHWQFPAPPRISAWDSAPHAAFPTYSFSIKRGEGLSLAVPISGVPVGLSIMNSREAHGTVEIADARTYGVDLYHVAHLVDRWAATRRTFLKAFSPQLPGEKHYLRAVTRVYLTGRLNVSLFNDEARGAAATVGTNSPATGSLDLTSQNAAANFAQVNKILNPDTAGVGGSLKVTAASSRSVTLTETFPRPLVIGYLAIDLPIEAEGRLGPPVPTGARLNDTPVLPTAPAMAFDEDESTKLISAWLDKAGHRDLLREWLVDHQIHSGITNVLYGDQHAGARAEIVLHFGIK